MSKLRVVIASTRPGRLGGRIGAWAADAARQHGGFEVELLDLVEFGLPMLDEPNLPRDALYTKEHTRRWSMKVDQAEAFVFVTPEYNHGPPPSLINALSYLHHEWHYKPVGFVSYGGVSAGTRAVEVIKQIVTTLKMMPIPEAVSIPFVFKLIQGSDFKPGPELEAAAVAMLDELRHWAGPLSNLRATRQPAAAIHEGATPVLPR
ncbi:NADPH-dependent FMN reductase [Mycobacterium triplex]|uniref:NADPH-dependent FMN reductase n=1 Tax=Mycobacterium triplex TaxID=47839 RepID=A0ABX3VVM0_9MYCO|nr:NADPH-dependent FMN reductase [Mycobacterium triplex]